ncbi:hypothetical protein OS493_033795 [Desmophyllum pertusum]|uniref:G-protein coupled receptors family 1 profile domain-containing protein n=1 Tax=Desmophyllum pertusum TaxID=174260 RepID=A0A9X0CNT3_9CNID|nr:hypothetical protein OS493_033795 [Desmophyllum pertusum]
MFCSNLAVADLFVGAVGLTFTTTRTIPNQEWTFHGDVSSVIAVLFSSVSVFSLLVISLERACAVVWPFRHRVASTRVYVMSIITVWFAGLCIATLNWLTLYDIISELNAFLCTTTTLFITLCMVLATYMMIRTRLRSTALVCAVETHNRKLIEQNIKLSKTLFIVIGLSFGFWLPAITTYSILAICNDCFTGIAYDIMMSIATVLHYANSLVNPIVYSYRMPMVKAAMKKLLRKKQNNLELTSVELR